MAAAGLWLSGTEATHTGLGWMGGLLLRMVLAFSVAEPGRAEEHKAKLSQPLPDNSGFEQHSAALVQAQSRLTVT